MRSAETGRGLVAPHPCNLEDQVAGVTAIRLVGAPRTILLDTWALLTPEGALPGSLAQKLEGFRRSSIDVVVRSDQPGTAAEALGVVSGIRVMPVVDVDRLRGPILAILAEPIALPSRVVAWNVGTGRAAPPYRTTHHAGPEATDRILALLGTAMVQTRAGAAFRAAGAGLAVPAEAPFDPAILEGIADAVAVHTGHGSRFTRRVVELLDLGRDTDRLVETAFQPLRAVQAPSGAIAAAPPPDEPDAPNYWFFWQRDAAQVVIALADLAAESGTLQGAARTMLDAYIGFVRRLPRQPGIGPADLGISRFSMEGEPIRSYGNPQNDGPAQAVLAVVAALGVGDPAYEVCRPYLDYLASCALGPGFDPWEFAVGDIFFDFNLARRALRLGARLAKACDDASGARRYTGRADEIERELEMFFDPAEGYIRAGRRFLQPLLRGISHLDISVVGSVLTAYDVRDPVLNVDHPLVSGTMKALERVSAERWPVNVAWQRAGRAGMGIARFPEDTNDGIGATGGNPWTFVTLWAAQFYLRSIQRLEFLGASDRGGARRAELLERADGYLQFVLAHLSPSALTEQIDGHTGEPRGARQLAWAQAALIQTLLLRRRIASAHTGQRT